MASLISLQFNEGVRMKKKKTKFTPVVGEGGSGHQASATENTLHFGRLSMKN